jgi:hypothetical protein
MPKAFRNTEIQESAQGARSAKTGMYAKYMRILSTAQRRDELEE